ncbi:MAG: hypothetical protein BWY56_02542 [Acidobacteria bacterium ADurb.Bin340]|nr:MAG: hypothetical protein BWY56_02542 [Acidobacteria bacterium ADurb.Bin340]
MLRYLHHSIPKHHAGTLRALGVRSIRGGYTVPEENLPQAKALIQDPHLPWGWEVDGLALALLEEDLAVNGYGEVLGLRGRAA